MQFRATVLSLSLLFCGGLFAACGGGGGGGLPACPSDGSTLAYDNFGKDFFTNYCLSCHTAGSGIAGAQDIPFETQADIQAMAEEIYEEAGGTNKEMPPNSGGAGPTDAERQQLAEWLSCGAK